MGDIVDSLFENLSGDEDFYLPSRNVECKYCGRSGFAWIKLPEGWRLHNPITGLIHKCAARNRQISFDPDKIKL